MMIITTSLVITMLAIIIIICILFIYDPYTPVKYWNYVITPFIVRPNPTEYLTWLHGNSDVIKDELKDSLRYIKPVKVSDINKYEKGLDLEDKWSMIYLRLFNMWTSNAYKYFPKTKKLLCKCPFRIGTCTFSCLHPGKIIPKHKGPYDGVHRCHIPIEIPKGDVGISITTSKGITKIFDWSKPFSFVDTDYHEAWNKTSKFRIVLIFDIICDSAFPLSILNDLFLSMSTLHCKYVM